MHGLTRSQATEAARQKFDWEHPPTAPYGSTSCHWPHPALAVDGSSGSPTRCCQTVTLPIRHESGAPSKFRLPLGLCGPWSICIYMFGWTNRTPI